MDAGDEGFEDLVRCIDWDAEHHGIGVRSIDEQHKILLGIVNQLCVLLQEEFSSPSEEVSPVKLSKTKRNRRHSAIFAVSCSNVVQQFVTYNARYLTAEQHMLDSYGYVDRVEHLKEHEKFEWEVCVVHKHCQEGIVERKDLTKLLMFMKEWVNVHIPHDKRYAAFMIDKGAN